jgi:hypothetical protein
MSPSGILGGSSPIRKLYRAYPKSGKIISESAMIRPEFAASINLITKFPTPFLPSCDVALPIHNPHI